MRFYRTVFSREALEFVVPANDAVFGEIEAWVNRIERAPVARGDYTEQDDDGRELQAAILAAVVITYWADDAAREVRVVRIKPL